MAFPIPFDAPVTMATLPASFCLFMVFENARPQALPAVSPKSRDATS